MKKAFTIIYSVIASLILIFSITFFAVNVYGEKAHGELRTSVRFGKIANGVTNTIKKDNLVNTETMRQIENTIGDTKDFSYIKITVDSKTIYKYPDDYEPQNNTESSLVLPYNYSYTTSDNRKLEVSAGMYSLRPSTIHHYAKISFFIILIIALLTIILIIYNNHFDKDKETSKLRSYKSKSNAKTDIDFDDTDSYEDDDEAEEEEYEDDDTQPYESDNSEPAVEITEQEEQETEYNAEEYGKYEEKPANTELPGKELEPVELEEVKSEQGLFSPDTGLGWESYLMTRLENELNRATASELDLSLFVIKLAGLDRKSDLMKKICDYLIVEFHDMRKSGSLLHPLIFFIPEDNLVKIDGNSLVVIGIGKYLIDIRIRSEINYLDRNLLDPDSHGCSPSVMTIKKKISLGMKLLYYKCIIKDILVMPDGESEFLLIFTYYLVAGSHAVESKLIISIRMQDGTGSLTNKHPLEEARLHRHHSSLLTSYVFCYLLFEFCLLSHYITPIS